MNSDYKNMTFSDLRFHIETAEKNGDESKASELKSELERQQNENKIRIQKEFEETKYKTFWPRFWAGLVDGLIFIPIVYLENLLLGYFNVESFANEILVALFAFDIYIYSVLMHAYFGKTIGKMFLGIRVLTIEENKISFKHAILRDIVPIFIMLISISSVLEIMFPQPMPSASISPIYFIITGFPLIWFLLEIVTMLFNKKRRALHDFIAGTVVMREY
jgi:uncharacterized RDD family membrane protein YckC